LGYRRGNPNDGTTFLLYIQCVLPCSGVVTVLTRPALRQRQLARVAPTGFVAGTGLSDGAPLALLVFPKRVPVVQMWRAARASRSSCLKRFATLRVFATVRVFVVQTLPAARGAQQNGVSTFGTREAWGQRHEGLDREPRADGR
jgi:hypothetical protein